ncbi:hypothetical protein BGZ63DRAFT_398727 [Mariannaea sp. PMI_226]|nr:hypothetical protein BGZ63DRAFT_398727 [Mariannaea sp. PMI_226]
MTSLVWAVTDITLLLAWARFMQGLFLSNARQHLLFAGVVLFVQAGWTKLIPQFQVSASTGVPTKEIKPPAFVTLDTREGQQATRMRLRCSSQCHLPLQSRIENQNIEVIYLHGIKSTPKYDGKST